MTRPAPIRNILKTDNLQDFWFPKNEDPLRPPFSLKGKIKPFFETYLSQFHFLKHIRLK